MSCFLWFKCGEYPFGSHFCEVFYQMLCLTPWSLPVQWKHVEKCDSLTRPNIVGSNSFSATSQPPIQEKSSQKTHSKISKNLILSCWVRPTGFAASSRAYDTRWGASQWRSNGCRTRWRVGFFGGRRCRSIWKKCEVWCVIWILCMYIIDINWRLSIWYIDTIHDIYTSCIHIYIYIYIYNIIFICENIYIYTYWKALICQYHKVSGNKPDFQPVPSFLAPEVFGFSSRGNDGILSKIWLREDPQDPWDW